MPIVPIRIPQIGEGLQEARLVAVLKQPGDRIERDEPVYQMETDKAVMDVESPIAGVLKRWTVEPDTILAIGAVVAEIESEEGEVVGAEAVVQATEAAAPPVEAERESRSRGIPPRTRAYAKEKGLSEIELAALAGSGQKLMPADIDAFLATRSEAAFDERPLTSKQRLLASRLVRGSQLVVPGTMSVVADWSAIAAAREQVKASGGDFQPSAFTMFAYCVAQALKDHPVFRSSLIGEDTLRTYRTASLGIAVALPGDELVLAVVRKAETLGWREFAEEARARILEAREGRDQADESVTISLTNMQAHGIRDAVPVVVPPAVGTLFLGEVYEDPKGRRCANLGLTFDHRLANGVGAAEFINTVRKNMESFQL